MSEPAVREAEGGDLFALLGLYAHLGDNPVPPDEPALRALWARILQTPGHAVLLADADGVPVSTCTLTIVQGLTHGQRPYAVIENVVTHPDYRGRGLATAVLREAQVRARAAGCYKAMLMTGSKRPETLAFYERAGFQRGTKTAFDMRIP